MAAGVARGLRGPSCRTSHTARALALLTLLAACSDDTVIPTTEPVVVASAGPSFDRANDLMAELTRAGLECRTLASLDPLGGFDPNFVEAPASSGARCGRQAGDLYLYTYATPELRDQALRNGEVNICRLEASAEAADSVVGANWRIASVDPDVLLNQVLDTLSGSSLETISCLGVE